MNNFLQKIGSLGNRLAEAGREARSASSAVTSELTDQLTQAIGVAAGEVVRAAVIGAMTAIVRNPRKSSRAYPQPGSDDSCNDLDDWSAPEIEAGDDVHAEPSFEQRRSHQPWSQAGRTQPGPQVRHSRWPLVLQRQFPVVAWLLRGSSPSQRSRHWLHGRVRTLQADEQNHAQFSMTYHRSQMPV